MMSDLYCYTWVIYIFPACVTVTHLIAFDGGGEGGEKKASWEKLNEKL